MSLLPLTHCFNLALGFFLVPIAVRDVAYSAANGQDAPGDPVSRTVMAALDPSNQKQLEFIFGGNVAAGSVGIYTRETLHIDDMYAAGEERMQSFVLDGGVTYRVVRVSDWTRQTGFYVYLGERHVAPDVV